MDSILNPETLATITRLEEEALRAMREVKNPVWRRHLEDLAAACDTVLACASRLIVAPTDSREGSTSHQGTPGECRCREA